MISVYLSSDPLFNEHFAGANPDLFQVRNQIRSLTMDQTWQQLILSAPPALNYLGLLMNLMSISDYNVVIPINYRVKFVNHTGSLRTKLTDFSLRFSSTIRSTENNLDEILSKFDHLTDSFKASIEFIKILSIDRAKTYLNKSLNHIEQSIEETSSLFNSIEQNFTTINEFLTELSQLVQGINHSSTQQIYNGEISTSVQDIKTHCQSISAFFEILTNGWNQSKQKVQLTFNRKILEVLNSSSQFVTDYDRQRLLTNLTQSATETDQSIAELIFITEIYLKISRDQLSNRDGQLENLITNSSAVSRINTEHQFWTNMITSAIEMVRLIEQEQDKFDKTFMN